MPTSSKKKVIGNKVSWLVEDLFGKMEILLLSLLKKKIMHAKSSERNDTISFPSSKVQVHRKSSQLSVISQVQYTKCRDGGKLFLRDRL